MPNVMLTSEDDHSDFVLPLYLRSLTEGFEVTDLKLLLKSSRLLSFFLYLMVSLYSPELSPEGNCFVKSILTVNKLLAVEYVQSLPSEYVSEPFSSKTVTAFLFPFPKSALIADKILSEGFIFTVIVFRFVPR